MIVRGKFVGTYRKDGQKWSETPWFRCILFYVSTTIAVGLITTISTLAGVAITGTITLLVTRAQVKGQLALAERNSHAQNARDKHQIRRDVYVNFLSQVDKVERELQRYWAWDPPPSAGPKEAFTDLMNDLMGALDVVLLEGPESVAEASRKNVEELSNEYGILAEILRRSDGTRSLSKVDHDLYEKTINLRTRARVVTIQASREALDDILGKAD